MFLKLTITTNDNKEFKIHSFEPSNSVSESELDSGFDSNVTNVDEILSYYCSNFYDVFPSVTIKYIQNEVFFQQSNNCILFYQES